MKMKSFIWNVTYYRKYQIDTDGGYVPIGESYNELINTNTRDINTIEHYLGNVLVVKAEFLGLARYLD